MFNYYFKSLSLAIRFSYYFKSLNLGPLSLDITLSN